MTQNTINIRKSFLCLDLRLVVGKINLSHTPCVMKKLKFHIFICTNERPDSDPRGCCKSKKAEELIPIFKREVSEAGLSPCVRAQRAGCLDTCAYGPSVVIYPEGVWYGGVKPEDVREIVRSHLVEGKPVQRLLIPGK